MKNLHFFFLLLPIWRCCVEAKPGTCKYIQYFNYNLANNTRSLIPEHVNCISYLNYEPFGIQYRTQETGIDKKVLCYSFEYFSALNGAWGEFAWSDCSATCEGTRNGARECVNLTLGGIKPSCHPDADGVTNTKTEACNVGVECPGEVNTTKI